MNVKPKMPQCCVTVFRSNGLWGGSRCSNRAKVEVGGKFYCGTHNPDAQARREEKRNAYYESHYRANNAKWAAEETRRAALKSLRMALRQEVSWEAVEAAGAAMLAAETVERETTASHAALQSGAKDSDAA
jgi:hypothetical protein